MVKKRDRSGEAERLAAVDKFINAAVDESSTAGIVGLELDAEECEPWAFHNRSDLWFLSDSDRDLAATIGEVGQMQPGLVRENKSGQGKHYQIIYGVRRWNACRTLGIHFRAEVLPADTSDAHCALLMEIENEKSANISEFEKALNYRRLLDGGIFSSQRELADDFGVSKQYVQKLVAATRLMDVDWLKTIFGPLLLSVSVANAARLLTLLAEEKAAKRIKSAAKLIKVDEEKDARQVFAVLIEAGLNTRKPEKTVLAKQGKNAIATCTKDGRGALTVKINTPDITPENRKQVLDSVVKHIEAQLR